MLDEQISAEHHFSVNVNLGWPKLHEYYLKIDDTPVYVAAVILHPRMKWQWLKKQWSDHDDWLKKARLQFMQLVLKYKLNLPPKNHWPPHRPNAIINAEDDVLSDEDDSEISVEQQLAAYEAEARHPTVLIVHSPIPYWHEQRYRWPEHAQLALDTFSTPAMSDEAERTFSEAGAVINTRRRLLHANTIEHIMCLRSWRRRGLFTWSQSLFDAVQAFEDPTTRDENVEAAKVVIQNAIEVEDD